VINQPIRRVLRADVLVHMRHVLLLRRAATLALGALLALPPLLVSESLRADPPIGPPVCSMRLSIEVTPDVPDPTDPGFLSSLLGNHPGYALYFLGKGDDTHVYVQLQGPGPGERCQEVVDSMRNDGRVASVGVS
jgi:hypothetical protein